MRYSAKTYIAVLAAALVAQSGITSCSDSLDGKKKVINTQDFGNAAVTGCGIILSLGDIEEAGGSDRASIVAQECISSQIPGSPEPWKALGISVNAGSVKVMSQGDDPDDAETSRLILEGTKIYVTWQGEKKHVATADERSETAAVAVADGINISLLVDGEPYSHGLRLDDAGDPEILLTLP
jgi:hypothetical protein